MKEGESRDYIFNLRKGFLKAPTWKRSKKAVAILRNLISRHSKVENVRLGKWLNAEIHKHGAKNPPSKVKINVKIEKIKDEKTKAEALVARAELAELPKKVIRLAKLEEEKKAKKKAKEKIPEKIEEKPKEKKKMDGALQEHYYRKNWSSFMLFNCDHPDVRQMMTPWTVNNMSGGYLHGFDWLQDSKIGELPVTWNWLEGFSKSTKKVPKNIHYTRGGPWFPDYQDVKYADLWLKEERLLEHTRNPKVSARPGIDAV